MSKDNGGPAFPSVGDQAERIGHLDHAFAQARVGVLRLLDPLYLLPDELFSFGLVPFDFAHAALQLARASARSIASDSA